MGKKRYRSEASSSLSDAEEAPGGRTHKRLKRDRWSVPQSLWKRTELCQGLYDFLRRYRSPGVGGGCLADFLLRAPSRRLLPEYYASISAPIDLSKIQQKLRASDYSSVVEFVADVRLLLENTKRFYPLSSSEHQTAITLETAFLGEMGERLQERDSSEEPLLLKIPKLLSPRAGHPPSLLISKQQQQQQQPRGSQSGAPQLRTKLTRSKAWLEEYLSSGVPVREYFASIYDHHDPISEEFVAELFHELPSRRDYPEYYRVITEPIDLATIRSNIEDGRYSNLKAIQDDLIQMIKNAHYFNEPGSSVYRAATSLKKAIISRCLELERRHQTVAKSIQPLKVSLKRPLSVGGEGGEGGEAKTPRVQVKPLGRQERMSATPSLSDGGSESESGEDVMSDDGDDGEGVKVEDGGKSPSFALRTRDFVSRLVVAKHEPSLKKKMMAVYKTVVAQTDQDGRPLSTLFMKRPAVFLYPEYYSVIKTPIDLREILQRIKAQRYQSLAELMTAIELLVSNACTFNEEDSQIYNDALVIKRVSSESCDRLEQAWSKATPTSGLMLSSSSGSGSSSSSEANPVFALLNHIRFFSVQLKAVQVRQVWHSFRVLPTQASNPDYYAAVKRPIDLTTIYNNAHSKKYAGGVTQLFDDLHLLCDNACSYYPRDSAKYRDAVLLFGTIVHKYLQLTEKQKPELKDFLPLSSDDSHTPPLPVVKETVQQLLVDIIAKTLDTKDAAGRRLVEALKGVSTTIKPPPSSSSSPTAGEEEEEEEGEDLPSRRVTLTRIHQLVLRGCYHRLDQLQDDLLAVLQAAASTGGGSQADLQAGGTKAAAAAAAALMRRYVSARNQVCQEGKRLWSPALEVTELPVSSELAPPSSPVDQSHDQPSSQGGGEEGITPATSSVGVAKEEGDSPDDSSCEYIQKAELEGVAYRLGDTVYVSNISSKADMKPHIVLIEKLWTDSSDKTWLNGCWFYHPEETFHVPTKKFYENEVFKSDFHGVASLSRVRGKCCLLSGRDFTKLRPDGYKEEDVYVCESRYSYKAKTFRPIKSAKCPGILQPSPSSSSSSDRPRLVARDSPAVLKKVPSVFAVAESGTGKREPDQTGGEEEEVIDVESEQLDSSVDILETSFSQEHKNVEVAPPPGGEAGSTHFQQYCIDENYFRLGDFVYLRSDQQLPYIARINKMWTDANGDPWFCGPWFIRPAETQHPPTKLFREKELFMSNIQDTNPMYSIIGKCAVLLCSDYCRMRPTEYSEADVLLVESRYDETEKSFKKLKSLKSFPSSSSVICDEVYHFPEDHQPLSVHSPKLRPLVSSYAAALPPAKPETPLLFSSLQPSSSSSGGGAISPSPITLPGLTSSAAKATLRQNMLQLTPQMVQSILASASQISTTRPVIIPLQQPTAFTSSPLLLAPSSPSSPQPETTTTVSSRTPSPVSSASSSTARLYVCRWEGCGLAFDSLLSLSNHVLAFGIGKKNTHLSKEVTETGSYYCRWLSCARNPTMGGKPFDVFTKLTRHLREVHLLKLSQSALGLSAAKTALTPAPSPLTVHKSMAPSLPLPPTPRRELSVVSEVKSTAATSSATAAASKGATPHAEKQGASTKTPPHVPNIFRPPPEDRRKLVHSEVYMKHLRTLQSNSKYMSSLDSSEKVRREQRFDPPKPIQASDWLSSDLIKKGTVAEVLWALRDHMMQDSLKLHRYLDPPPP